MPDDLLTPTITEPVTPADPPWRVESLVYPAFFGGPLAVAYLGVVNAHPLGLPDPKAALIFTSGLAGLIALPAAVALLRQESTGVLRFTYALTGVAVWGVVQLLQRRPYRIYLMRGGQPAGLWWPGIGAALAAGLIQFVLGTLVNSAVDR